jgi:hypothetical protein
MEKSSLSLTFAALAGLAHSNGPLQAPQQGFHANEGY